MKYVKKRLFIIGFFTILFSKPGLALDLTVNVINIKSSDGMIGCALHSDPESFPMDGEKAQQIWLEATAPSVVCEFKNIEEGQYAVAVSHDLNGNKKVDTNFLGMPKEDWGTSNNIRPRMRAPRFEEAQITLTSSQTIEISIDR